MSKRAKEKAELIANGIMISVQGKTGRVVYNTKEKSFTHYELMCAAQKGYEQAEKDLAMSYPLPEDTVLFQKGVEEGRRLEKDDLVLTWEDMAKIDAIILDVNNEFAVDYSKEIDRQKFYEEVLRRFNEIKYGHEKDTK